MGRFYQTATPQKIDFMHKLPEQAMMQAMMVTDKKAADTDAAIHDLYGKLKANALHWDKQRKDEILKSYESNIDELAKKFQENPLAFQQTKNLTKQLSREIYNDWTRGEIAAIQGNYNSRADFQKRYMKAVQEGKANAKDFEVAMAYFDSQFDKKGGTLFDKEAGAGNVYSTEELAKYVDMETLAETRGEGYIADFKKKFGAWSDGKYIYKSENSKEVIPAQDIYEGVLSAMQNDKELMDYWNQQIKFGNATDKERDLRLQLAAKRVAEKYDMNRDISGKTGMSGDPYGLKTAQHEYDKKLHAFKEDYDKRSDIPTDLNNKQQTYKPTKATTKKELFDNIQAMKENVNKPIEQLRALVGDKMLAKIGKDGNVKEAYDELANAVEAAKNGNFSDLRRLVGEYDVQGFKGKDGKYIGTGVDEIQQTWLAQQGEITNQQTLLNVLEKNAENTIKEKYQEDYNTKLKAINKQVEDRRKQMTKNGFLPENVEQQLKQYEKDQIAALDAARDRMVASEKDNLVNSYLANPENKTNMSVYSTGGNYYEDKVPETDRARFNKFMGEVGKNVFEFLGTEGNAAVTYVETMENGKMVQKPVNFDQLIADKVFTHEQFKQIMDDPEGKGKIVVHGEGGKMVTYRQGDMRVIPQYMGDQLGYNAYQVTLVAQNPTANMPKSYTFMIPKNDIPPSEFIENIYKSKEVDTYADEVEMMAQAKFQPFVNRKEINKEQAEFTAKHAPNVTYNPYVVDIGGNQGRWTFTDPKTGASKSYYGNVGKEQYKNVLRQEQYGDSYAVETVNGPLKSKSETKSETTSKTTR